MSRCRRDANQCFSARNSRADIFDEEKTRRPHGRFTVRQSIRVLAVCSNSRYSEGHAGDAVAKDASVYAISRTSPAGEG
jgi:hypothetical protein